MSDVTVHIVRAVELLAIARELTPAQRAIVELVALGETSHGRIAKARGVERSTIKSQVHDIMKKTGRASLLELAYDVLLVALALACPDQPSSSSSSPATILPDGGGIGGG